MRVSDVKELSAADRLRYWITERELIRLKKESGQPPPWTDDDILRTYRFCNVRRMDDRVSKWLLDNWYSPEHNHPNTVVACVLARQVNTPATLRDIGFPFRWDPERVQKVIEDRMATGEKAYSAAYMITANYGPKGRAKETKGYQTAFRVCRPFVDDPPQIDRSSMERTWRTLLDYPGMSFFMAGQVVADLRHALIGTWADRNDWAPVGPGSARGLARLIYRRDEWENVARDYTSSSAAKDGTGAWLDDFGEHVLGGVRSRLPGPIVRRMEAHDYQNCLCEFDKYERVLHGEGRPKQLYRPRV